MEQHFNSFYFAIVQIVYRIVLALKFGAASELGEVRLRGQRCSSRYRTRVTRKFLVQTAMRYAVKGGVYVLV